MDVDADLYLVTGLVLIVLLIPSLLSAFTDGRTPRVPMLVLLVAGTLIVMALNRKPGGYSWDQVPEAFATVVGRIID